MTIITEIFRTRKKEGLYLYIKKGVSFETLPDALRQHFGTPERAMTLVLNPERKLARVDVAEVISALEDQGYYLQMPPRYGQSDA